MGSNPGEVTTRGRPTRGSPLREASRPVPEASYRRPRSVRVHRADGRQEVVGLDAELEYRLGRAPDNTISFEGDETVSRVHGQLSCDGDGNWFYSDQRSRNGSFAMPSNEFARGELYADRLLKPYDHVLVEAGDVILLAKGRSRLELLAEPAQPDATPRTRWASEAGRRLEAQLARAARSDACVFLLGPSGSGKTFLAAQLHASSKRRDKLFLPLNCGRLPKDPTSLHSELLGHVTGAFTGASSARVGALVAAHGGTVFLDEVESLPPEGQAFLLDLVEQGGGLRPLGSSPRVAPLELDLRFVSASKVPLEESGLRHDLSERLSACAIELPALEERREDIPALAAALMAEQRWPVERPPRIDREAMQLLQSRVYRGQIRELRDALNVVGHDVVDMAEEVGLPPEKAVLTAAALQAYFDGRSRAHERRHKTVMIEAAALTPSTSAASPARKRPEDLSRDEVSAALRSHAGNQAHACEALGVSLNTLKKKMKIYGLRREDFLER